MIENDPETALKQAIPKSVSSQFPLEVQKNIEREVSLQEKIEIVHYDDFEKGVGAYKYYLASNNKKKELFSAGQIQQIIPQSTVRVAGYQLDNKVVAHAKNINVNTTFL